jgi:hypothetical protein
MIVLGSSDVANAYLSKVRANILGTVRLLARHDCLYPSLSGLLTEPQRLEAGNARDGRIADAVRSCAMGLRHD